MSHELVQHSRLCVLVVAVLAILPCPVQMNSYSEERQHKELISTLKEMKRQFVGGLNRLGQSINYKLSSLKEGIINELQPMLPCPHPWRSYHGLCLLISNVKMPWWDAEYWCVARGGNLVYILSKEEHQLINDYATRKCNSGSWYNIGLYKTDQKNLLMWSSGHKAHYTGNLAQNSKWLQFFKAKREKKMTYLISGDWVGIPCTVCRRRMWGR